jgi:MYXO-CTERM domain-containing protein
VWVVDGAVRRHVVSRASLDAWHLTTVKWPAAKIAALVQGPDWQASPFVFKGDGATVYALDVAPGTPPASGAGAPAESSPPGSSAAEAPSASSGCAVTTRGAAPGPWVLLVGALVFLRRRRH